MSKAKKPVEASAEVIGAVAAKELPTKKGGDVNKTALCVEAIKALGGPDSAKGEVIKEWIKTNYGYTKVSDPNIAQAKIKLRGGTGKGKRTGKAQSSGAQPSVELIRQLGGLVNEAGFAQVKEALSVIQEIRQG
jgi:hypothetical protein